MDIPTIIYDGSNSGIYYILNTTRKELLWWEFGDSFATENEISQKFEKLKKQWLADTFMLSSPRLKYDNENYKEIIKLDSFILPFLIKDLRENNNDWLFALRKITNTNPIKKEHEGNFQLMKQDWLNWAEKNIVELYAFNDFRYAGCAEAKFPQPV